MAASRKAIRLPKTGPHSLTDSASSKQLPFPLATGIKLDKFGL